jgi:hypothetical protein
MNKPTPSVSFPPRRRGFSVYYRESGDTGQWAWHSDHEFWSPAVECARHVSTFGCDAIVNDNRGASERMVNEAKAKKGVRQ